MNTSSHIILHLGIRKYFQGKDIQIPKSFVFGALAPDIGLYLCVFLYIPISILLLGNSFEYTMTHMFQELYFEHPIWIFSYNILHAPLTLTLFLGLIYLLQNYLGKHYKMLYWFIIGCMLHSAFDIPLHHDDGPRIFYPFSDYRFSSPVSYWDTNYYAGYIMPLEFGLSLLILGYLVYTRFKK